jgi:hypothetical protein
VRHGGGSSVAWREGQRELGGRGAGVQRRSEELQASGRAAPATTWQRPCSGPCRGQVQPASARTNRPAVPSKPAAPFSGPRCLGAGSSCARHPQPTHLWQLHKRHPSPPTAQPRHRPHLARAQAVPVVLERLALGLGLGHVALEGRGGLEQVGPDVVKGRPARGRRGGGAVVAGQPAGGGRRAVGGG